MATLKDVARESGLTVTTVSRVLNNRGYISDNARERVAEAMKKLNYRPNEAARSLQNKSSNTIGVILPHICHPYFSEMLSNLEKEAKKFDYKLLIYNSHGRNDRMLEYVNMCVSNRVAGLILFSGGVETSMFHNLSIPVITLERFLDSGTASVECDNVEGGAIAAQHLLDCGCQYLLHVIGVTDNRMPAEYRKNGFKRVCDEQNIPFVKIIAPTEHFDNMDYMDLLENTLKQYPDIDGIFANSDVIAAQIIQVCRKLNISVPEKLKVVGFDDSFVSTLTAPQLTTIHQPVKEMAEIAMNLLHKAIEGDLVPKRTVLPVRLVVRESTI